MRMIWSSRFYRGLAFIAKQSWGSGNLPWTVCLEEHAWWQRPRCSGQVWSGRPRQRSRFQLFYIACIAFPWSLRWDHLVPSHERPLHNQVSKSMVKAVASNYAHHPCEGCQCPCHDSAPTSPWDQTVAISFCYRGNEGPVLPSRWFKNRWSGSGDVVGRFERWWGRLLGCDVGEESNRDTDRVSRGSWR